jgi:replication factor C subunit 1
MSVCYNYLLNPLHHTGIFRNPNLTDVQRMEKLSAASDSVSDSDLAAAAIRGQDMHWELLTTQAVMCVRAGAGVQGFQAFPTFPAWLGKNSTTGKMQRLTKEIVHHTSLCIGQGFQPIRLDYVPYLRYVCLYACIPGLASPQY